jgi:hypothetical protein
MLQSVGPRDTSVLENCRHMTGGTAVLPCVGSFMRHVVNRDVGDGWPNRRMGTNGHTRCDGTQTPSTAVRFMMTG